MDKEGGGGWGGAGGVCWGRDGGIGEWGERRRGREGKPVAATTASSLRQLFISDAIVYSSEDTIRT